MSILNPYATLADFKQFLTPRMQSINTDAQDDTTMEAILGGVSRWIDDQCHHTFYPRYEIRWFDIPPYDSASRRLLLLDDDLLQEVTVTNGDGTVITSANYHTKPYNASPIWGIELVYPSTVFWMFNAKGERDHVISIEGWWGYRKKFSQRGWVSGGTLGAAITDATGLTFTMTAGHTLKVNQVVKIDTELFNVATVATNTITAISRGDNGSTAATHSNGAAVSIWSVQPEITEAAKAIAANLYATNSGQVPEGKIQVTAAGVVIRPEDVPAYAKIILQHYTSVVPWSND